MVIDYSEFQMCFNVLICVKCSYVYFCAETVGWCKDKAGVLS